MPDELTEAQLDELKADLLDVIETLRQTAAATADAAETVHLDQAAVGRISRIDAIQQQQMAKDQQRRNGLRLKQAMVALAAFEDEAYGWCKRCDEPVGYRRLKARPETVVCVPCQTRLEAERGR